MRRKARRMNKQKKKIGAQSKENKQLNLNLTIFYGKIQTHGTHRQDVG